MIGAIAGDVIGSRFEGQAAPPADFALFHARCRFTDDTVCSLAVADALMRGEDFDLVLREHVRRHPDRGYGGMFLSWSMSDTATAYGSWGNGAPMRVAAVGWLARDEAQVMADAAAQAAVSHDHPDAIAAAQAVATAIFALRRGAPVDEVRDGISGRFGYDLRPESALAGGGFDVSAAGTAPAALAAAFESTDWEEAARTAVCLGGDTDTLACIAGAVAEAIHGVPHEIAQNARSYLTEDLAAILARFHSVLARR